MALQIKLFGNVEIENNGRSSAVMKRSKGVGLLAYLLITRETHSREAIADLLWDARTTAQSLNNLRKLLYRLRDDLPRLSISRKQIAYSPDTLDDIDLYKMESALAAADIEQLNDTLALYTGDLLTRFYLPDAPRFNEWLILERERWRHKVWEGYRQVCEAYTAQQEWLKGTAAARRWLLLDEFDEEALRYLLRFMAASGQVVAALQQFGHNRERLWQELGVEPERETVELGQQLTRLKLEKGGSGSWDTIVGAQVAWPAEDELAEPGLLPANSYLLYHRNDDFTGRRNSLLRLANTLLPRPDNDQARPRAAAVTGMGGIGKTQLAVEFVYRYGRYFPGGVFWISFAKEDEVADQVAIIGGERGMGLYRGGDRLTQGDRISRVQKAWQEAVPRLLIFDNCEKETLLAQWLPKTGGCRVLITSRRGRWARDLGVVQQPLPVLDPHESVAFMQRLLPHLDAESTVEIARELGRLPLALHLAGGFLRRYSQINTEQYLAQLRDSSLLRHPSLQGRGTELSPTEHDLNVARTFRLSLEQFDPQDEVDEMARLLLACTASFAPGEPIPQDLLRAVVYQDNEDLHAMLLVEDGLTRLVTLGLLASEGAESVIMHRLLAAFAREELTLSEREAGETAVAQALLKPLVPYLSSRSFPHELPYAPAHLRYVTESAIENSHPLTVRLVLALSHYLSLGSEYVEAARYILRVEEQAVIAASAYEQGVMQFTLAKALKYQGRDRQAFKRIRKAEAILRQTEPASPQRLGQVLVDKGWLLYHQGDAAAAIAAAEESRALTAASGDAMALINSLNLLGVLHYQNLGQYDAAAAYLTEALELAREHGLTKAETSMLLNLGEIARLQGKPEQAIELIQAALVELRQSAHLIREFLARNNLHGAQVEAGFFVEGAAGLEELINQVSPEWRILSESYRFLAEAYLGLGQDAAALTAAQASMAHARRIQEPRELAEAWTILGRVSAQLNQAVQVNPLDTALVDAAACFTESLRRFDEQKLQRSRALVLWYWASFEMARGKESKAQVKWQEARAIFVRQNLTVFVVKMDKALNT